MTDKNWRTPTVVLVCAGIIITLAMGTRAGFGLFLKPMTFDLGWSRETFAFAMALQNLILGASAPLVGLIADRKGAGRVLTAGAALYALGLVLMAMSTTGWQLYLSAGVLIGIAQGCATYSVVFGVLGRTFGPERRSMVLGIASAAGSFGQFAMLPYSQMLITHIGWFDALLVLAVTASLIAPLATALVERRKDASSNVRTQTGGEALREAFAHKGFLLLTAGYFVCGFQLAFMTVHFPAYVADNGFGATAGMTALALVGLFNIFGSYGAGALGQKYAKKYLLSFIYFARAIAIALFIFLPMSEASIYVFASVLGLLWLATVPLTSGMIGQIFGVAYMSTLTGIAFFSHQIGSFIGIWLGGYLFDHTGSYQLVWMISIALGIFAGLINLPIDERAIHRAPAMQSAA
jgi:MFS family permease